VSIYYRDASIFLIVFDLKNLHTLDEIDDYYFNTIIERSITDYKCIVVGNKADLVTEETIKTVDRKIRDRFKQFEAQLPLPISYVYVSALNGNNLQELLTEIGKAGDELESRKKTRGNANKSNDNNNNDVVNLSVVERITSWIPSCPC